MRGADGTRDSAGPGLGHSRFGAAAAPASCPWGCELGPGGWSGAPFCPVHRPPGAAEPERSWWQLPVPPQAASCPLSPSTVEAASRAWSSFRHGVELWNEPEGPSEEEEEDEEELEEERWLGFQEPWVLLCEDGNIPYGYRDSETLFVSPWPLLPVRLPPSLLETKMGKLPAPWGHCLTAEEAERNARELVAEEERMKRKAEKKKLKKKKQKDRKKREKLEQEQQRDQEAKSSTPAADPRRPQSGAKEKGGRLGPGDSSGPGYSSGEERGGQGAKAEELEEELDLSCTFVSKARQKAGVKLPVPGKEKPVPGKEKPARTDGTEPGKRAPGKVPQPLASPVPTPQQPKAEPPDASVVQQSLILAGQGNEAAQRGCYAEAVQAFTHALRLNPREHRLFGNRSFCLEKLWRYEEALRDAQEALRLQPGWPKGLFRKGKALRGLQRYAEAIVTFEELLCWAGTDAEAAAQLQACRALLPNSHPSSAGGVPVSPSPLEAGEPTTPLLGSWASGHRQDTDTSGFVTVVGSRSQARVQGRPAASSPQPLPPFHPARDCYPLWVGNITPSISEMVLQRAFGRFGAIRFIRLLPGRRCAFVNFVEKKAAEAAFAAMQDAKLEGSQLLLQLKHPSHATPSPLHHPEARATVGRLL